MLSLFWEGGGDSWPSQEMTDALEGDLAACGQKHVQMMQRGQGGPAQGFFLSFSLPLLKHPMKTICTNEATVKSTSLTDVF